MALSTQQEIVSSHTRPVNCLAIERQDNQFLLSGGLDGMVAMYDLHGADYSCKEMRRRSVKNISMACNSLRSRGNRGGAGSTTGPTLSVAISSVNWYPEDSGIFATTDYDGNLNIWDTNEFVIVGNFNLRSKIFNAKFKDDGSLIAVALDDHSIRLCDPSCGDCTHVLSGHSAGVTCVEWCPSDEYILASASWDGKIKLWDVRKGSYDAALLSFDWQQDHTAKAEYSVKSSYDTNSAQNHRVDSAQSVHQHVTYYAPLTQHSASRNNSTPHAISYFEMAAQDHEEMNRMKKFNWTKDQLAKAHESSGVTSILYSPCGRYLVSSGNDRKVRLWSSNNGHLHGINYGIKCTSNLPFSMEIISDFSCSGDDVLVYPNGEKGEIALVALHSSTGVPFARLRGHLGAVTSLVYRKKHCQIVSAGKDGMIHVWDSSLADKEREIESGRYDSKVKISLEGESSAGAVENQNDDNWSDDDDNNDNDSNNNYGNSNDNGNDGSNDIFRFDNDDRNNNNKSDGRDASGNIQNKSARVPSRPKGYFIPPIVQRYLDDAAAAKKKFIAEQGMIIKRRAEIATVAGKAVSATANKRVRLGETNRATTEAHGGDDKVTLVSIGAKHGNEDSIVNVNGSSAVVRSRLTAPTYRHGSSVGKIKVKAKEKSHKERAEVLFALTTVAALRNVPPSSSSSPSSHSSLHESNSTTSGNVTSVAVVAADSTHSTYSDHAQSDTISNSSSSSTIVSREKEKEKEKETYKSKKSTLSMLRSTYGSKVTKKSR